MREPINPIDVKWQQWRDENPRVYPLFQHFAAQAVRKGRRFGIGALTERVRWEVRMRWGKDEQGFKINNNYRAYIARDLAKDMPGVAPLIETRRVHREAQAA